MKKIDISILKEPPNLTQKVTLEIKPLAPISMVNDLPGSFYKSLKSPSKKMLCGLFENTLGWHFSFNDRTKIQKEMIKTRKKQKVEFVKPQIGSTYIPLLMEYFEIDLVTVPEHFMYNDLWSRLYRRADTVKHLGGTRFMDAPFMSKWRHLKNLLENDDKRKGKEKILEFLFKRYIGKFPTFYSSPTEREYIQLKDDISIQLKLDNQLLSYLTASINENNLVYIGNNEGWVNLKISKHE